MSRVIILSFRDNDVAEHFARQVLEGQENAMCSVLPATGVKIEALIARPTQKCKGPHRVPGKLRSQMGWSRTRRYGWWVCSVCNKCAPKVVRDFITNMIGGYNNLLTELTGENPEEPAPWYRYRRPYGTL
jgi:hypothetical protein